MFHACLSFIYCPQASTAVYYTTLAKARHASMNFSTYGNAGQVSNYSRNFSALPTIGFFTNNSGLSIRITNKNFTLNRVNCHASSVRYRICAIFLYLMLLSDTIMRNRIHELDYLKCLFIILMIIFHLSHIGSKYPYAKSIVYTFHMPAFLLISGYLINVHKKPEIFLKAMAWIFIPYTIMEISYACMSMLFPVWDGIKEINASVLLGKVLLDPIGPYWYLHTFILCGTTYYFVHTYLSSTPFIRLLVTSSLLLLFSYIFHLLTFANAFYFMAGTAIHLGNVRSYLVSPLLFLPLSLWFSVQPAGESEQRHFRRHINYRIGHQPFAVHLQTSSPYCEASFTVHRKEHIAYSSFLPRLYRTVQTLSAFFSFDPTGICFLCTATVITLYGSIFIAFCLDKACLSPFFFGKKILI